MIRFLSDEHISDILIAALRRASPGIEIVRVRDTLLSGNPDDRLLEWAAEHRYILITHDKRMVTHFKDRIAAEKHVFAVFLLLPYASLSTVINDLALIVGSSDESEWEGQFQYIPLWPSQFSS